MRNAEEVLEARRKELSIAMAKKAILASADSAQVPPVPIPNTVVKLSSAENTCLETDREDREVLAFSFK